MTQTWVKVLPGGFAPSRAHFADAGVDFRTPEAFTLRAGESIEHLEQMPSAQPEIIRCKDCKHWDGVDTCDVIDAPVWDKDFCSMAERRSDEE